MDAFALLGTGIRFDKKRFQKDVEIFQKRRATPSQATNDMPQLPSVDFFQDASTESQKNQSTKLDKKKSDKKTTDASEATRKRPAESPSIIEEEQLVTEEQINVFRKKHRIRIYGHEEVAKPITSFDDLFQRHEFSKFLCRAVRSSGFCQPTPIQMQSIPILLEGRDLIACAPTGSGKTLAFLLPLVHLLQTPSKDGIRALIISPTRELAQQIHRELEQLVPQMKGLKAVVLSKSNVGHSEKKFDILITTPMRLVHAIEQNLIDLHKVQNLIMDEADKLFEMGFLEQIDTILAACTSSKIQKSLFSATIHSHIEQLAQTVMKEPLRVVIGAKNSVTEDIDQKLVYVGQEEGKLVAIRQLIQQGIRPPVLIFVESIDRAKELFHELIYDGINVDVIHSDRTQAQRDQIIQNFRAGKIWVLIATDLLGRGIDFKGVQLVINYDFPRTLSSYIHRIGRTGRAGRRGEAITYFMKEDAPYLRSIAQVMRDSGCEIPEWMLKLPKPSKWKYILQKEKEKKQLKEQKQTGEGQRSSQSHPHKKRKQQ